MKNVTCDDYMLPIGSRSSEVAKERTSREHLAGRSRELVRDAHINVFCSVATAVISVEDLHPFDGDRSAVVDCKPR